MKKIDALKIKYCPYKDDELILLDSYDKLTVEQKKIALDYAMLLARAQKEGAR